MINTYFNNYGIFSSGKPTDNDLISLYKQYGVRKILSLDRTVGDEVSAQLKRLNLPIEQEIFHISPGSPTGECTSFINNVQSHFNKFPILVHCRAGKDRTGFAIASWLIKTGKLNACSAKETVEKVIGYGTGGISEVAKNSMDRILGCLVNKKETVDTKDPNQLKKLTDKSSVIDGFTIDNYNNVGQGADLQNIGRGNYIDPYMSIYPTPMTFPENDTQLVTENTSDYYLQNYDLQSDASYGAGIIKRSSVRKKLLKKILTRLLNLKNKDISNNDDFKIPKQLNGLNSGQIDNYSGFANTFTNPSGAPGAPNGAAYTDSTGYIQI